METPGPTLNKPLVGCLALGCLTTAIGVHELAPTQEALFAALWRVSLMLSALWLALPKKGEPVTLGRFGPVLIGGVLLIVLIPRSARTLFTLLPLAIGLGIAALVLRPKSKRR
ncbi:MAG: hypothetical protein HZA46_15660 [Planctomycetales bacterium]|nr:hypothetical protein [Planctomycetales bacterium]